MHDLKLLLRSDRLRTEALIGPCLAKRSPCLFGSENEERERNRDWIQPDSAAFVVHHEFYHNLSNNGRGLRNCS